MNRDAVCLALGSNLGDRAANLEAAIDRLRNFEGVDLEAVSSFHETKPIGGPSGQGPFLNAAARLSAEHNPFELLTICREIERRFGRDRDGRWNERTLDIDILLVGERLIETPELRVPHPRMMVRRFVLAPLAEIAGEVFEPRTGRTIADLLANLDRRPTIVLLSSDWSESIRASAFDRLRREWGAVVISDVGESGVEAIPQGDLLVGAGWNKRAADRREIPWAPTFAIGPIHDADRLDRRIPTVGIESEDPETIVAEIVAACAASRG